MVGALVSLAILLASDLEAGGSPDGLIGKWSSIDQSKGITRLEISSENGVTKIHTWGATGYGLESGKPTERDHGETTLHLLADSVDDKQFKYGFAHRDNKFSDVYMTLHRDGETLILERVTVFKDGSDRSNTLLVYKFKASQ